MLFEMQHILDVAAGDAEMSQDLTRAVKFLADELNSGLPEYEVRLVHLDTYDYLEFIRREPVAEEA